MQADPHLRVWCLLRDQFGHVRPVEECLGGRAEFIYDAEWDPHRMLASVPQLVMCVNDFPYDVSRCLDTARRNGIPTLVLQDGILEWRCQYENPLLGAGGGSPQHQPVLADKIACLGAASARHIASWGNAGKVEVTGMPRLDALLSRIPPAPARPGGRILVLTAKKPAFDDAQMLRTLQSLRDVQVLLGTRSEVAPLWRLTKNLSEILGVENHLRDLGGGELCDQICRADAVIATPSTAMLESMLLGRPVACLDYHNTPRFVSTAWTISSPAQLPAVIDEICRPSAAKMAFQRCCLHDALHCASPAAPRVARLIERMIALAQDAKQRDVRLRLPARLLPDGAVAGNGHLPPLREFYPGPSVFAERDPARLQVRLARAEKENQFLKRRLRARGFSRWIERFRRGAADRFHLRNRGQAV